MSANVTAFSITEIASTSAIAKVGKSNYMVLVLSCKWDQMCMLINIMLAVRSGCYLGMAIRTMLSKLSHQGLIEEQFSSLHEQQWV